MECRIDRGQWLLELALGCLPNAEAFSISLRAGDECDLGRLFEGSLQIESVKRLYLYRLVGEDHPINMDQLDSFLAMVPRVEQLEMNVSGRLRQNLPLAEVRSLIVAENSLTRLGLEKLVSSCPKLERFEYRSASLDTRIRWQRGREEVTWREAQSLLHQRRETLKHLDFDFGEDYLSFRDDELQPWDYLDSFREFDRLETLLVRTAGFGEEGDGEQEPAFPASAEHLVEMLPQSLTVLGFCGEHRKWDGVGRLAQAIRQGNFQKLKRVLLEIVDDFEGSREILRTVGVVAKRYDGRYQTFSYYSHDWL
ncbi:f-box-like domain-containing [Trichoderma arundinaceum]|uniref:F-box-like domain-containing n=1 Tax=Trichoderma arundinaceum TaxID=490622 RepID=A0A395N899_TRIAR|nr:f-box-like domain-containing [Trichoderma arundinaceum]